MLMIFFLNSFLFISALSEEQVISINQGSIRGSSLEWRESTMYQFLGIPFGAPPTGSRRFLKPEPASGWKGIYDAIEYGPACVQTNESNVSEDCLSLNIYVSKKAFDNRNQGEPKSVLFWIHGGLHRRGNSAELGKHVYPLVLLGDIIVVTANYRLGAFGWLYFGNEEPRIPGNMGLWDQNLALKWVNENIKFFGGDPNKVTIAGVSAGSRSVSAHLLSPQSTGLFQAAILESGSMVDYFSLQNIAVNSHLIRTKVGCGGGNNALECLQIKVNPSRLAKESIGLYPVFDNDFLPNNLTQGFSQSYFNNVPILLGANEEDGSRILGLIEPNYDMTLKNLNMSKAKNILGQIFSIETSPYVKLEDEVEYRFWESIYLSHTDESEPADFRKALMRAATDRSYFCSTIMFGVLAVNASIDNNYETSIYGYYFSQTATAESIPVKPAHGKDNVFWIGKVLAESDKYSPQDVELSKKMVNIWATFVKTGKPPNHGTAQWDKFRLNSYPLAVLNSQTNSLFARDRSQFCNDNWSHFQKVIEKIWTKYQLPYNNEG